MRRISVVLITVMTASILMMQGASPCPAIRTMPGQKAPGFSIKDIQGKTYDLAGTENRSMTILYFFDAQSRPSQEGLLSLDRLAKHFSGQNLLIWAITTSSPALATEFISQNHPAFPVLLDSGYVSKRYGAQMILPTVCIIGPDQVVMDTFQGGGKTTEIMLVRLAERTLQQKKTAVAKAISDAVTKRDPGNLDAKAVKGYAEIKEGNLAAAETLFKGILRQRGDGEVLGKEGLSLVYAKRGEHQKALDLAGEVERKAPARPLAHLVKADILYSEKKGSAAEAEYRKAVAPKDANPLHRAEALNKFGRFYAAIGKFNQARELYDQAVEVDPYYVEATANKGVTYERQGKWDEALASYRQAQRLDSTDRITAVLTRKAEQMLALQRNTARTNEIHRLVKELAERYRNQKATRPKAEDTWTSRPMVLTFLDLQDKGGLSERDGISMVLSTQLGDDLNGSGRLKVVDRAILDQLLSELNLGSSDLADPETALHLGRVLAAKLIGTGSLLHLPRGTLMSLRLIDTETTAVPLVINRELNLQRHLSKTIRNLSREILTSIIEKYPLKGFVVQADPDRVMINLGANQGVVQGTRFEAIEASEPVIYKGRRLQPAPRNIAQVEVVKVEPDLSYAKVLHQDRPLKRDDKLVENLATALSPNPSGSAL
jgi:tetratricopeptide (TPR) repeat protein